MKSNIKSLQQASYTKSTDPRQVSKKRPKPSENQTPTSDHYNISLHVLSTQLKCDDKDELYKMAISRAKDSFNRYFNDQEHLKDIDKNNDIFINVENLEKTYDKKKNQLMGHMENLVAIKKELTERAKNSIGHYFSKEKNQYYMDEVDTLYSNYQEEQRRLKEFKQKIEYLKKTA